MFKKYPDDLAVFCLAEGPVSQVSQIRGSQLYENSFKFCM